MLYPDKATYIEAVRIAAQNAVDMGYLLSVDAVTIITEAQMHWQ